MSSQNSFKKKFKVILIGSMVTLGTVGIIVVLTIFSIQKNVEYSQKVSLTTNSISACQSSMRNFLLNAWSDTTFVKDGTNQEFEKFKESALTFEKNISELKEKVDGEDLEMVKNTESAFNDLKKDFLKIGSLITERGFKDLGLEGKLRESVHKIEKSDIIEDKTAILILRKHEKDFFLRKDVKYISNFNKDIEKIETQIAGLTDDEKKIELKNAIEEYQATFNKIVEMEKQIGLGKNEGLRGEIEKLTASGIKNLEELNQSFNQKTSSLIATVLIVLIIIFAIIILLVFVGLNKLIKPVFEPMHLIQHKAAEISEGNLSVKFDDLRDNAILRELIEGFEKIILKFKTTMSQIEGISSRKQLSEIAVNSESDEVGVTLNKIITQIRQIDEEDKQRTWHNEGLAKFGNILRLNNNDEAALYDSILRDLVKYLGANQGAIFIIEGEEDKDPHMLMKACYAYERKKFLNMRVDYGNGLTGACWAEGELIYLTEVPADYVKITSGIGEATPRSIIIVPILFNDKVQGVIEIASVHIFEDHHIKFSRAIAENVGSAIHNLKTNTKTASLLQRSQEMTEELRAQEEEMRQNMEELQATQEEMVRMSTNLQKEVEELRNENENLKSQIVSDSNEI